MPVMDWFAADVPDLPLPPPSGKTLLRELRLNGKRICLVWHKDTWFALDARCPHANGPLAYGSIDDKDRIVCPWHRFAFDLTTGNSDSGGYFIDTYAVKETAGGISIGFPRKKKGWFW
ncbi:MAG: (2Fe-2S)-binding protein [Bacteroidetes bacterium]|nr:MAG: (2Fe-2S)-binding protein [Bacteroidota bacterium]